MILQVAGDGCASQRGGRRRARATPEATEESTMGHLLLASTRRGAPHTLRSGLRLLSIALLVVGCASHTLMPKEQAVAIADRDRALVSHADAIQAAIRQSGNVGAVAFLDAKDGSLVVLPGD